MDLENKSETESKTEPKVIIENRMKKEEPKDNGAKKDAKPDLKVVPEPKKKAEKKGDVEFQYIALSKIEVDAGANPRKVFDREYLKGLADSIREKGILHPLTVTLRDGKYVLIAGECRLRAAKIVGLTTVPVRLMDDDVTGSDLTRVIENMQRTNLSPMEEAISLKKLLGKTVMREDPQNSKKQVPVVLNVKNLSLMIGKSPGHVSQRLTLLELHKDIQQSLIKNEITVSQARELHSTGDEKLQLKLLSKIKGSDETVRVKDIKADIDRTKAKRTMAEDGGKPRGRPPREEGVAPNVARQGLEAALEHLKDVKLNLKKVTEVREGMAVVYERFDKSKSDEKKMFYKGAIAALEWATGIKEDL